MSVTEFICDFIKNLAPLCDATDEHRVVMAFPVVVIYQKGSDDITICGKGNYKSLILRLKSFYRFFNKKKSAHFVFVILFFLFDEQKRVLKQMSE